MEARLTLMLLLAMPAMLVSAGVADSSHERYGDTMVMLLRRVEDLETLGRSQILAIERLNTQLRYQSNEISELKAINDQQTAKLLQQERQIQFLEDLSKKHQESILTTREDDQDDRDAEGTNTMETHQNVRKSNAIQSVAADNLTMPDLVQSRPARLGESISVPVAFHVILNGNEILHLGINQIIIFDTVVTNLGGGYHHNIGTFIAPRSGVYIFSLSVLSHGQTSGNMDIYASIQQNGKHLASAYGYGHHQDQGSVTVTTQVNVGDEVMVRYVGADADGSVWGNSFSSFTGCLIM